MTKPLFICLACACCHTHTITACDAHECTDEKKAKFTVEQNIAAVQKELDTQMKEYVEELLKVQKSEKMQTIALLYSRKLAWLQERLDELSNTKTKELARYNGNILFYQDRLVGKMNSKLMANFESAIETQTSSLTA
jgi:hypothetical protein